MANLNLIPFSTKSKGEGNLDAGTILNKNFDLIRQLLNEIDERLTVLES